MSYEMIAQSLDKTHAVFAERHDAGWHWYEARKREGKNWVATSGPRHSKIAALVEARCNATPPAELCDLVKVPDRAPQLGVKGSRTGPLSKDDPKYQTYLNAFPAKLRGALEKTGQDLRVLYKEYRKIGKAEMEKKYGDA